MATVCSRRSCEESLVFAIWPALLVNGPMVITVRGIVSYSR